MTMNTKSTGETTTKSTANEASNDFLKAYARLRTVLDSMEITALRYCLMDTNSAKRIKRAKEIENVVMPVIKEFESKIPKQSLRPCPDDLFNCDGCCLPYPCVP